MKHNAKRKVIEFGCGKQDESPYFNGDLLSFVVHSYSYLMMQWNSIIKWMV